MKSRNQVKPRAGYRITWQFARLFKVVVDSARTEV